MAPPSKLTPEIQTHICQLLRAGNTVQTATESIGISTTAFYEWKNSKPEFREAVEQAEAEAEALLVTRISKAAAAGSWRAACWLLERRNPEKWGSARDRQGDDEPAAPEGFEALDELAPRRSGYRVKNGA